MPEAGSRPANQLGRRPPTPALPPRWAALWPALAWGAIVVQPVRRGLAGGPASVLGAWAMVLGMVVLMVLEVHKVIAQPGHRRMIGATMVILGLIATLMTIGG